MIQYFKKKWQAYLKEKSLWSKISDGIFVAFVVAMLIPTSRRELSALMIRIISFAPSEVDRDKQIKIPESTYQWNLISMDGKSVKLSDFQGKPLFVNFWATWCPPCVAELPEIQDLYDEYSGKIAFILISDESPETIQAFFKSKNYHLPVFYTQSGIPEVFMTNSLPTTYIVDPQGYIVINKTGAAKWNSNSMHQLFDKMLLP